MQFTKMHGAGNDYLYVDCFRQPMPPNPDRLSRVLSDRHFGVGGDGLILICPPQDPANDARMRMFNADGSEGEMCGNATRCIAKYLYEHGLVRKERLRLETGRGILTLELLLRNETVERVRVNMCAPIFDPKLIPTMLAGNPPIEVPLMVDGQTMGVTCVSMGNPHAVVFVDEITDAHVLGLGPKIECHEAFPRKTNVEFAQILSPTEIRMRVWERGSGETLACGTGASAVCVAGVLTKRAQRQVRIHLVGGDLDLEWSERDNCVYMTGGANEVFTGEVHPSLLAQAV